MIRVFILYILRSINRWRLARLARWNRWRDQFGRHKRQKTALQELIGHPDDLQAGDRVCLFATYDPHQLVDPHVLHLLRAIAEQGFKIVFVTAATGIRPQDRNVLTECCTLIIRKNNVGWDFGSWKIASEQIRPLYEFKEVLLMNDSVYGPLYDLKEVMANIAAAREADLVGLTDSWDQKYHLQSYFLVLRPDFLRSEAFQIFWRKPTLYSKQKDIIITDFELELTAVALRNGFRVHALYPYKDVVQPYRKIIQAALQQELELFGEEWTRYQSDLGAATPIGMLPKHTSARINVYETILHALENHIPLNPSHFMGNYLVLEHQFPFIKGEYLRKNPVTVHYPVSGWETVESCTDYYPPHLIHDHLKRIGQNHAPF